MISLVIEYFHWSLFSDMISSLICLLNPISLSLISFLSLFSLSNFFFLLILSFFFKFTFFCYLFLQISSRLDFLISDLFLFSLIFLAFFLSSQLRFFSPNFSSFFFHYLYFFFFFIHPPTHFIKNQFGLNLTTVCLLVMIGLLNNQDISLLSQKFECEPFHCMLMLSLFCRLQVFFFEPQVCFHLRNRAYANTNKLCIHWWVQFVRQFFKIGFELQAVGHLLYQKTTNMVLIELVLDKLCGMSKGL